MEWERMHIEIVIKMKMKAHVTVYSLSLFSFLFLKFSLLLSSGILVLLVLRNKVIHVGLCLSEFHLIHTFSCVPMQESLAPKHSSKLFTDTFEELLDSRTVTNKS